MQENLIKWQRCCKKWGTGKLFPYLFVKNNISKFHKKYIGNIKMICYNKIEVIMCIMYLLLTMKTE